MPVVTSLIFSLSFFAVVVVGLKVLRLQFWTEKEEEDSGLEKASGWAVDFHHDPTTDEM